MTRVYEEVHRTDRFATSFSCSRCGEEMGGHAAVSGSVHHNFGSTKDGELWVFELCSPCADWLAKQVKMEVI